MEIIPEIPAISWLIEIWEYTYRGGAIPRDTNGGGWDEEVVSDIGILSIIGMEIR